MQSEQDAEQDIERKITALDVCEFVFENETCFLRCEYLIKVRGQ